MSRRIEYLPLADLRGNAANPKGHALDVIDASIGRFGVVEPVVRDERTGMLISGHGRTATLQGMEERGVAAPEGVQVAQDGRWHVPVVVGWSSTDDNEAGAALIALNRTGEIGGWVDDALLDLLDNLGDDLSGIGYDDSEVDDLRSRLEEATGFQPGNPPPESPKFDGGEGIDVGDGEHTCPRCRFTFG